MCEQSQLGRAVFTEDYEDAARLKVAIAAAATNDTVGRVMAYLNVWKTSLESIFWLVFLPFNLLCVRVRVWLSFFQKAVVEERFQDAAYIRDNAGAGLVSYFN